MATLPAHDYEFINGVESGSFVCVEYEPGGGIRITVADSTGAPAMSAVLTPAAGDKFRAQLTAIYADHGLERC